MLAVKNQPYWKLTLMLWQRSTSQHLKQDIVYNPIRIHNTKIQFTEQAEKAEHVGVIRSVDGNLPNILNRIVSHKRALNAVLSCGLTRAHRSNPAAALRVLQLYSTPVLLSGLASLVLTKSEIATIDHHFLDTMLNLFQKLLLNYILFRRIFACHCTASSELTIFIFHHH